MSTKEIERRRHFFAGRLKYTGKEFETIERIIKDKKYNNIQLSRIVQRMFLQHAPSNSLSTSAPDYIKYLDSL